jgi:Uma2 family endonuclease
MSPPLQDPTLSQYLEQERQTGEKHEYYRGELFAMVGGTPQHALIATNFLREASQALKDSRCVAFNSDLRIKVEASGLYTYPDASIICGELQLDRELSNTILNPSVLVEVLSDSTERYDRGTKSFHYRSLPTLQHLVLISQDCVFVECFTRINANEWLLREYRQRCDSLVLESVNISIPLAELYRNVPVD